MKYCVSARQPAAFLLRSADEIKLELRDYRILENLLEDYSYDKTIILDIDEDELPPELDWDSLGAYAEKWGHFICAIKNPNQMDECMERKIPWYYRYSVSTFQDLKALSELGARYVLIEAPLFFQMDEVKKFNIPIRVVANLAYEPYIYRPIGLCGAWLRPEDVNLYEDYIETLEFYTDKGAEAERALYKVYAENKSWNDNLESLIVNLDTPVYNTSVLTEEGFGKRRLNCGQKCMIGKCDICRTLVELSNYLRKNYKDEVIQNLH